MALIFAEGFDDYSTETDLSLSAASVTSNCSITAGRGGNGFAAKITGTNGNISYAVPTSAAGELIAGFAMQGISGIDAADIARVQFLSGGVPLFSIVQASASGLLFFDATNTLVTADTINLTSGLIGAGTYKNWQSYIEVQLMPGNPGQVVVKIDGSTVLNTSGIFSAQIGTTLTNPTYVGPGTTSITVQTDLGQTVPFNARILRISGGNEGVSQLFTVTATGGAGNTTWTLYPLGGSVTFQDGDTITVYPQISTVNGLGFSTLSATYGAGAQQVAVDDLYMCSAAGALNNAFLGNTRIISAAPSGDGALLDWTPSSGTAHWSLVDAYPINYGATEVTATAAGNQDSYTFPALPSLGAFTLLRAIQIVDYCESTSGGTDTIAGLAYIGGVSYPGTPKPMPAVWQAVPTIMELNPATAAQWTGASVNAAQFGQRRSA